MSPITIGCTTSRANEVDDLSRRPRDPFRYLARRMPRSLMVTLTLAVIAGCNNSTEPPNPISQPERPTQSNTMPTLDSTVIEEIDVLVRSAFWDRDRILEIMCEELYAPGDLDENAVAVAITSSIAEWQAGQKEWPDETDCDRLDQAFAKLNQHGVIALHNAGMTQSDGYDDFREIYEDHPKQNEIIGYCYYHGQDLARVARGGPLFFSFGPCDPKLEETEGPKVGRAIVKHLTDAGLKVEWEGTFDKRMSIPIFSWQRRAAPEAK